MTIFKGLRTKEKGRRSKKELDKKRNKKKPRVSLEHNLIGCTGE
jgi:hypothetical protein